ncbi:SDR family NAD(P)-dependent oxidoreductase [Mesorhizobium sp. M0518]|uniref:SDR family oxidoreductase n=1 Tax=Mesorhizobium sp. M0518 TaxID=2956956 RepID=UPI0033353D03
MVGIPERERRVESELSASGRIGRFSQCDLAQESTVETLVDEVAGHFGRLDIVVNNARLGSKGYRRRGQTRHPLG